MALLNSGEPQRAREVLEQGGVGNSRNQRALYLLSEAQRRMRDYAAAEVTARRLIALDPRAVLGARQLAQILLDQNEHQKVVALVEPIVTPRLKAADAADMQSETFRQLYFDLATAYEQLRQHDKAIALLRQAQALVSSFFPDIFPLATSEPVLLLLTGLALLSLASVGSNRQR